MNRPQFPVRWISLAAALALCLGGILPPGYGGETASARLRRPVALAFAREQQQLIVANAASGSVSVVELPAGRVAAEADLGRRLSDLAALGQERFLATDETAHELILFELAGNQPRVMQRLAVSPYPVEVVVDASRQRAYVASLWSRRLTVIQWTADPPTIAAAKVVDLDFPPRKMTLVREGRKLMIADAFVGQLATYDAFRDAIEASRSFFGHNVRGLTATADDRMLLIGHQMLNELAHTVQNDVHWGLLMSNDLRWLRLDSLLDPDKVLYAGGHMHPVGEANDAAADPNGVAVAPDGTAVVALGGVNQIGVGRERDFRLERYRVGRRPTEVTIAPDGTTAAIANTLDDTITLFDLARREEIAVIALGQQPALTPAERGEQLFYDGSLSLEGWMSCHSCHTDGHSGGLLNDNRSDGSFGAPKRVLSLLGVADTAPYAWNGEVESLQEQIHRSVSHTMQRQSPLRQSDAEAIAQYLHALKLPPSLDELRGTADPAAIARGGELFTSLACNRCHAPPHYTTPKAYDVGIHDKLGNRSFNPPSLRGLSHRRAFFHDSRATDLAEVFEVHGHQLEVPLSEAELGDLLAFLRSL